MLRTSHKRGQGRLHAAQRSRQDGSNLKALPGPLLPPRGLVAPTTWASPPEMALISATDDWDHAAVSSGLAIALYTICKAGKTSQHRQPSTLSRYCTEIGSPTCRARARNSQKFCMLLCRIWAAAFSRFSGLNVCSIFCTANKAVGGL